MVSLVIGLTIKLQLSIYEKEKQKAEMASQAKADFLSNMSHEIRTPINAVLGMNEMIQRESTEENILAYADNISSAGKNLLSIINDVLDFSKIEAGKIDISENAYSTKDFFYHLSTLIENRAKEKGLSLTFEIDENLPQKLLGDEFHLSQILMNLLTNAVNYTDYGSILMSVSLIPPKEDVIVKEDSVSLLFSVSDTGRGIKKEDLSRLFASFERLDEKKNRSIEGTGLGLAISKLLTELMGGEVHVESTYGEGSTFSFHLTQKIIDPTPIGDYTLSAASNNHTITGNMNLIDETPVIALTANAIAGAKRMYLSEGFSDYMTKPINGVFLEKMIRDWLPSHLIQQI